MAKRLKDFLRDESGAALDTAVLNIGLALLIVPTVQDAGSRVVSVFEKLARALR